jgi:hypothetical protein
MTAHPAWRRKISALRRIVFESSITMTLTPDNVFCSATMAFPLRDAAFCI